jgi:hypothetical protein
MTLLMWTRTQNRSAVTVAGRLISERHWRANSSWRARLRYARYCKRVSRIVAVHGVGQQMKGANILRSTWLPALRDGLTLAGVSAFSEGDLTCAFYGDLFRPRGTKTRGSPRLVASDVATELELPLLLAFWEEAARIQPEVASPQDQVKARVPILTQRALHALSKSKFFSGLTERMIIGDLKQVSSYLHDESVRNAVHDRIADAITGDTRVLVGHSLGSVVAYEVLASGAYAQVGTFVTLGSPLGIPNFVFDRLRPAPLDGCGVWPGKLQTWVNVADLGDVVALEKCLARRFAGNVVDVLVNNGAKAHDIRPYLTAFETGTAIAAGLHKAL